MQRQVSNINNDIVPVFCVSEECIHIKISIVAFDVKKVTFRAKSIVL